MGSANKKRTSIAPIEPRARRQRLPKDEGDRQIATVPSNLLDRQFMAERPNQKWIADFTYIWTAGYLSPGYLSPVEFERKVELAYCS